MEANYWCGEWVFLKYLPYDVVLGNQLPWNVFIVHCFLKIVMITHEMWEMKFPVSCALNYSLLQMCLA